MKLKDFGLKVKDLTNISFSKARASDILNGLTTPTYAEMEKLATLTGIPVDDLYQKLGSVIEEEGTDE